MNISDIDTVMGKTKLITVMSVEWIKRAMWLPERIKNRTHKEGVDTFILNDGLIQGKNNRSF